MKMKYGIEQNLGARGILFGFGACFAEPMQGKNRLKGYLSRQARLHE